MRIGITLDSLQSGINHDWMAAKNVKETRVYKLAFELAMEIFEVTKDFPKEEKYSLIDQIRRSPRSVCICLIEAYRKEKYPFHFVSNATDSDMELWNHWLAGFLISLQVYRRNCLHEIEL